MKRFTILFLIFFTISAFSQDLPAYILYTKDGKQTNYSEMIKKLEQADIVLFGEYHNNTIAHWLELIVTKSLFEAKGNDLILGAEMFESDNQLILDEFLNETIAEKNFEEEMRLWDNYQTDYKPIVTFAKDNKIPFIATNVPRRYANLVFRNGFEGLNELSNEAKKFIPPLPIEYDPELNCYKQMLEGMKGMKGQANENFPKAQAIKDATMTFFILKNWSEGKLFLHFNGSYHSDNQEGIFWYLTQNVIELNIITITTVTQENILNLEENNKNLADFIICVPSDMTTTY